MTESFRTLDLPCRSATPRAGQKAQSQGLWDRVRM